MENEKSPQKRERSRKIYVSFLINLVFIVAVYAMHIRGAISIEMFVALSSFSGGILGVIVD